jgi:hypothetical protein
MDRLLPTGIIGRIVVFDKSWPWGPPSSSSGGSWFDKIGYKIGAKVSTMEKHETLG